MFFHQSIDKANSSVYCECELEIICTTEISVINNKMKSLDRIYEILFGEEKKGFILIKRCSCVAPSFRRIMSDYAISYFPFPYPFPYTFFQMFA